MTEKKFVREFLGFVIIPLIVLTYSLAQALPIEVYFDLSNQTVLVEDTFSIRLAADISDQNPVDKFGLDLTFEESILSLDTISLGSLWGPGIAFDGDGLAGFALGPVYGDDITLATLTFTALDIGITDLTAGYTVTDMFEGFFIPPPAFPLSRYDDSLLKFYTGSVSVAIPEPASFILLVIGLLIGFWLGCFRRT